jgi:CheY-like chemotaxis protein
MVTSRISKGLFVYNNIAHKDKIMTVINALILDDNNNNIIVLEQLLKQENITYRSFTSATRLLEALDTLPSIDIAFVDLEMPRTTGYEMLDMMKAHPNFKNTRFVAYSVHVAELSETLERGFQAFLGKPLSAELFSEQIQKILRGEQVYYLP